MNIVRKIRKIIWKFKIKLLSAQKEVLPTTKKTNSLERFDDQFKTGFWDYLSNLDELGHYSIIAGYCYFWKPHPSILDVGCGQGVLQGRLNIGSYSYFEGIDFSKEAILQAEHRVDAKTTFRVTPILDYKTEKLFDIIIFSESLYYLDNINEISKVIDRYTQFLEVNGKIIISHYNYAQNINKIWI